MLLVGVSAIYFSEHRRDSAAVSANAVLAVAADAQRDLTRLPMRLTRISDQEEVAVGNQLAQQYSINDENVSAEDLALDAYIGRVGKTLAAHAHRRLPYSFRLLPNHSVLNAFSLPGGPVYVGEGLLDQMTSEDELASVIGHEIEHIDHYHCAERIQIEAQLRHVNLGVIGALVQIPLSVWEAGYNKDEELEADREGMRLAVLAGYSPYGAVTLFERFAKSRKSFNVRSPRWVANRLNFVDLSSFIRQG